MKTTPPTAESHPNLFAWFCLVKRFTDDVRKTWGGAAATAPKAEKKAAPAKTAEPKKEEKPKKEGDEELDLFGDEGEEDAVSLLFNSN